jgi:hypothetical protein
MRSVHRVALACALVVFTTVIGVGVSAGTANAAVSGGYPIQKVTTIWSNPLNVGQSAGVIYPGAQAQVWISGANDWINRWVVGGGEYDGWFVYLNLYTGLCLSATGTGYDAPVTQEYCSSSDPKQRWAFDGSLAYFVGSMPVRNKWLNQQSSTPLVLTQANSWVGSYVTTRPWTGSFYQYWLSVSCGTRTGAYPYTYNTPTHC